MKFRIMESTHIYHILNFQKMKKPNFTPFIFSDLLRRNKKTIWAFSFLIATLLIFSTATVHAQDCNIPLGCNNGVNISMDDECTILLEPDMILKDQAYPNSFYDVEASINGVPLASTIIGITKRVIVPRAFVGRTIQVKVSLRGCNNACWGNALIEDKLPPQVDVCPCEERITRFEGEVRGDSPTYLKFSSSVCLDPMLNIPPVRVDYKTFQFATTATGIVDINLEQTNLTFALYVGDFDENNSCLYKYDQHISNQRSFSNTLQAGTNYFLVVSSNTDNPAGFNIAITNLAIESRTGSIIASADGSACTLQCESEASLLAETIATARNKPTFTDNCSAANKITVTKKDSVSVLGCDSRFSKVIKRTWVAKDEYGNESDPKIQYFYVNRLSLAEITCPSDVTLSCDVLAAPTYKRLPNGAPDPSFSGVPTNLSCQNIQMYYTDEIFPLCGVGVKVFRQWTIIDWCSGEDRICHQAIKIVDERAPIIQCPDRVARATATTLPIAARVSTGTENCVGRWIALPPRVTSECSKFKWDIAFKKNAPAGLPPVGTIYTKVDGLTRVNGNETNFVTAIDTTARPFAIENLPLGRTWVQYTVTDECGFSSQCVTAIDVVDNTPPVAICNATKVVSIDEAGFAEVFAINIDNNSYDNCGIAKMEIRRTNSTCPGYANDRQFGPGVKVCCNDFNNGLTGVVNIVLRVYDAAGNSNDCETTLTVQNKRNPTLVCPGDKTLLCNDPKAVAWIAGNQRFDTLFFGAPALGGVCGTGPFGSRIISDNRNPKCGTGIVVREWFLTNNPAVKCQQTLNLISTAFRDTSVVFPGPLTVPTCDLDDVTPEALNSRPIVRGTACRDLGISHSDREFYGEEGACIKIIRTWKVIDWCTYNENPVVAERTQTIKLTGSEAPTFIGCKNDTISTSANRCDIDAVISVEAEDDCTDADEIKYTWKLDINKDGSFNANGLGRSFTRLLEVGTHRVVFTAENRCGAIGTCTKDIVIVSSKKPTPICLREVVWVLDASGVTTVWASDFNLKSEGSCGSQGQLKFSFNAAGTQTSKSFSCADIPNGQFARIPLRMYVIDKFGNSDYCEVILNLQDSPLNNKCTDVGALLPKVEGRIRTEAQAGLKDVEVTMTNMQNAAEKQFMTDADGKYKFDGVDVFDPKSIEAVNDLNHLNGVTTLDLVMIQRHVLGIAKLPTPYKLLAADANNSKTITAADLIALRKLILGVTLKIEDNTSWRFVPEYYTFADPTYPFDYPEMISIDSIFEDRGNVNFVAVKVGDVNNSVVLNADNNPLESRTSAFMTTDEASYQAGDIVKIDVRAGDDMTILGAQLGIAYDNRNLEFLTVESGAYDIKDQNFRHHGDQVMISYDRTNTLTAAADEVLFTLVFKAVGSGKSTLKLDESVISPEVYGEMLDIQRLDLQVRDRASKGQNILYQNEPNPFDENTKIAFELAQAGTATISVIDMTGKVVYRISDTFGKGYHAIMIDASHLQNAGVYYYKVDTAGFNATKKMIVIK
jgi:hypothetical protein